MQFLLASLLLLAADPKPAGPPPVSDAEVPSYLSRAELSEWGNALRFVRQGEERVRQGSSIVASAAIKRSTQGAFAETPEQVKARGQKLINEGNDQIRRAQPSLVKLRAVAAAKKADLTKPVVHQAEVLRHDWTMATALAAVRLQKLARDGGFKQVHLVGAVAYDLEGNSVRSGALADSIRAAWEKADPKSLSPAPAGGYSYVAPDGDSLTPSFAPKLDRAAAPRTVGVLWAELFPLSADASTSLLFIRFADAFNCRILGSEAFLTTAGPSQAPLKELTVSLSLADARSFIPRLAASGEWVLGYDRAAPPLGAALLRHLCVKDARVAVGCSAAVVTVIGGDAPSDDGARAKFSLLSAASTGLGRVFRVSGGTGADLVAVGDLELRVSEPPAPKK
ncbi:MAG: hypothetical protein ACO3ND_09405 [Opitutales bacterium]